VSGYLVPSNDVEWCSVLATALSVCCVAPVPDRLAEVRAYICNPPIQMLPMTWHALMGAAESWVARCDAQKPGALLPQFPAIRLIEAALRNKPVPVPVWAERYA
jgi:hypothetical protein